MHIDLKGYESARTLLAGKARCALRFGCRGPCAAPVARALPLADTKGYPWSRFGCRGPCAASVARMRAKPASVGAADAEARRERRERAPGLLYRRSGGTVRMPHCCVGSSRRGSVSRKTRRASGERK